MQSDDAGMMRSVEPGRAVTGAIQNLVATRLGRGFIPLVLSFAMGAVGFAVGVPRSIGVAVGAVAAGSAMLGYGMRIVQRAAGRPARFWMTVAMGASIVPPGYAMYLLGWRGLRGLASQGGPGGMLSATLYVALGVWLLRSWMKVLEVERLARIMDLNLDTDGESA